MPKKMDQTSVNCPRREMALYRELAKSQGRSLSGYFATVMRQVHALQLAEREMYEMSPFNPKNQNHVKRTTRGSRA